MNLPIAPEVSDYYEKSIKSLPKGSYAYDHQKTFWVSMRDGIRLAATAYFPQGSGPWPVLFTRNPYAQNKSMLEAIYLPLITHGYCIVIQDCRGTGLSEGDWEPFIHERDDGIDSLNWLSKQPWMDGNIATFGRSYSCFTQWIVADCLPKQVKTMFLEVYGVDRYRQVYMNGMFREDIYTSWAFANSGVPSAQPAAELYRRALEIQPAEKRDAILLGTTLPFYQQYLSQRSENSPYWKDSIWQVLKEMPKKMSVPVVITDGWADHHLDGSLQGFEELNPSIKSESRLLIGPWDHMGNTTGDLPYPNNSPFGFMNIKAHLDWFHAKLKGKGTGVASQVYIIGKNTWYPVSDWPPAAQREYLYFSADKKLLAQPQKGECSFFYNPQKPLTAPGGSALLAWITPGFTDLEHGIVRQPEYTHRKDTLVFQSEPLTQPLTLLGKTEVKLRISSSAKDTAFFVRLIERFPDGRGYNITDGISSLSYRNHAVEPQPYQPGEKVEICITLWDTGWQFHKGSRIELLVSSSNFPMYCIHSNTEGPWAKLGKSTVVAKQTIYCEPDGSSLSLPVIHKV